jgi:hypothetical protein
LFVCVLFVSAVQMKGLSEACIAMEAREKQLLQRREAQDLELRGLQAELETIIARVLEAGRDPYGEKKLGGMQIEAELAAVSAGAALKAQIDGSADRIAAMDRLTVQHTASLLRPLSPTDAASDAGSGSGMGVPVVAAALSTAPVTTAGCSEEEAEEAEEPREVMAAAGSRARRPVVISSTGLTKDRARSAGAGSSLARSPQPLPLRTPPGALAPAHGHGKTKPKTRLKAQTESRVVTASTNSSASRTGRPATAARRGSVRGSSSTSRPRAGAASAVAQPFSVHDTNVVYAGAGAGARGSGAELDDTGSVCSITARSDASVTSAESSGEQNQQYTDELVDTSRQLIQQIRQRLLTPVAVPVSVSSAPDSGTI